MPLFLVLHNKILESHKVRTRKVYFGNDFVLESFFIPMNWERKWKTCNLELRSSEQVEMVR